MRDDVPHAHHRSSDQACRALSRARVRLALGVQLGEVKSDTIAPAGEQLGEILSPQCGAGHRLQMALESLPGCLYGLAVVATIEEVRSGIPDRWMQARRRKLRTSRTEDRRHPLLLGEPRAQHHQSVAIRLERMRSVQLLFRGAGDRQLIRADVGRDLPSQFESRQHRRLLDLKRLLPELAERRTLAIFRLDVDSIELVDGGNRVVDDLEGSSYIHRFIVPHEFNVGVHGLRRTCATLLLERGVAPHVVQERLGHKDVSITLGLYSHVLEGQETDAARLLGDALWGAGSGR